MIKLSIADIVKLSSIFIMVLGSFFILSNAHTKQKSYLDILKNVEVLAKPVQLDIPLSKIIAPVKIEVKYHKTRTGDNFNTVFKKLGMNNLDIYRSTNALFKLSKRIKLKVNNKIYVSYNTSKKGNRSLKKIEIYVSDIQKYEINRNSEGKFFASKKNVELLSKLQVTSGKINSSLYQDTIAAGIPVNIVLKFIDLYSFDLDFQRDIRKGDKFQIFYETFHNEQGKLVKTGDIIFCKFVNQGKSLVNYRYTTSRGTTIYLNQDGSSVKRTLLKTPISGARISSNYGYRRHPILGYTKLHSGIDFAAKTGTPIYAAGDGTIKAIKWYGGYGRYIKIRHNSKYSTAYAHMSRFKKGLRKGSRVKQGQIIGYVGSTGRSTGPHLHYEVHKNNKSINPKKVKTQSKITLKSKELKKFLNHKERITFILTNAFAEARI